MSAAPLTHNWSVVQLINPWQHGAAKFIFGVKLNMRLSYRIKTALGGLIVIPFALSACGTFYSDVTSGDASTVLFSNGTGEKMTLIIYDDATECTGRRVSKPPVSPGEERKLIVTANRELALTFAHRGNPVTSCNATFTFIPVAGKTYEIHTRPGSEVCSQYRVLERAESDGERGALRPVTTHERKWHAPLMESTPSCEPEPGHN